MDVSLSGAIHIWSGVLPKCDGLLVVAGIFSILLVSALKLASRWLIGALCLFTLAVTAWPVATSTDNYEDADKHNSLWTEMTNTIKGQNARQSVVQLPWAYEHAEDFYEEDDCYLNISDPQAMPEAEAKEDLYGDEPDAPEYADADMQQLSAVWGSPEVGFSA